MIHKIWKKKKIHKIWVIKFDYSSLNIWLVQFYPSEMRDQLIVSSLIFSDYELRDQNQIYTEFYGWKNIFYFSFFLFMICLMTFWNHRLNIGSANVFLSYKSINFFPKARKKAIWLRLRVNYTSLLQSIAEWQLKPKWQSCSSSLT